VVAKRKRYAVLGFLGGSRIIHIEHYGAIAIVLKYLPVDLFNSFNQSGLTIEVNTLVLRFFQIPPSSHGTAFFYQVTRLTPLEGFFHIFNAAFSCG
jgi:hypothetical protein